MIINREFKIWGLMVFCALILLPFFPLPAMAQMCDTTGVTCATDPSECASKEKTDANGNKTNVRPPNCLFLEEPIGGKANYDLYLQTCTQDSNKQWQCVTSLWNGGSISTSTTTTLYRGPIQAILTEDPAKKYQGSFGLLYSYVKLIYAYMSGIIVGISVLFVVVGGVQMTTSGGDQAKFDDGKKRITRAVVGIIIWFTASLILYTINPTFFAF